jgi:hypothetical protein
MFIWLMAAEQLLRLWRQPAAWDSPADSQAYGRGFSYSSSCWPSWLPAQVRGDEAFINSFAKEGFMMYGLGFGFSSAWTWILVLFVLLAVVAAAGGYAGGYGY